MVSNVVPMANIRVCLSLILILNAVKCEKPNIIIVVIDDLGWDDVSLHGSNQIPTPHIDNLAFRGVLLESYYTQAICTPSRGALMTGMYPINLGLQHDVIGGAEPWGLPTEYKIFPQYLEGYKKHIVGKWHLGHHRSEYLPTSRGFDSHFGFRLGHSDYYDHWGEESSNVTDEPYVGLDLWNNQFPLKNHHGKYATELFTKRALDILETHDKSSPLFLYLAHQAVHVGDSTEPLQAPHRFVGRFYGSIFEEKRLHYAAMVSAMDDAVGNLMAAVYKNGYGNNTIVFFTNDNGGPTNGMAYSGSSNFPLRGCKYTLWEGGVRGTGILWAPGLLKPSTYSGLFHISDVMPTLLAAAGIQVPGQQLDGIAMWNKIVNNTGNSRQDLLHNIDPEWNTWAYREGDYKLISGAWDDGNYDGWYPTADSKNDSRTINCGQNSSNTFCDGVQRPCLFNIKQDPCERNDIFDSHRDIAQGLAQKVANYREKMKPLENKPITADADPARFDYVWMPWEDYI